MVIKFVGFIGITSRHLLIDIVSDYPIEIVQEITKCSEWWMLRMWQMDYHFGHLWVILQTNDPENPGWFGEDAGWLQQAVNVWNFPKK